MMKSFLGPARRHAFLAAGALLVAAPAPSAADVSTDALPDFLERLATSEDLLAVSVPGQTPKVERITKYLLPARSDPGLLPVMFQNANRYRFHVDFLRTVFPDRFPDLGMSEYLDLVERRETRDYYAGTLALYTGLGRPAVLGFTVYTDGSDARELLEPAEVLDVYKRLQAALPIPIALEYAPARTAEVLKARTWVNPGFPILFSPSTTPPDYVAYTRAVNYGRLRRLSLAQLDQALAAGTIGWQDLLVLDDAPPDIETVVAGVVTAVPQGELSHLTVRLAGRGVPNAYLKNARQAFAAWEGKLVRLAVEPDRHTVAEATLAEAEAWWAAHRPSIRPIPFPDEVYAGLDLVTAIDAGAPGGVALRRFGGKAAGLARLYAFLPDEYQTQGFAIPFRFYHEFLRGNRRQSFADPTEEVTYEEFAAELLADPRFRSDAAFRRAALEEFVDYAEDNGRVDPAVVTLLGGRIAEVFGSPAVKVRFRSSSNAEDSLEFNAAGLYESTSVCYQDDLDGDTSGPCRCDPLEPNERTVARGLKRVWMSLWIPRAFEEREYYQIDHARAAMAILVTRAYPAEDANGVAFTGNPANREDRSFLVNVQIGDTGVVSPPPGVESEKDLLVMDGARVGRILRARESSLLVPGQFVLADQQLHELGEVLALVAAEFPRGLDLEGHPPGDVLVDVEFKFQDGQLVLKQARPFLIRDSSPAGPAHRLVVPPGTVVCGLWEEFRGGLGEEPHEERKAHLEYRLKSRIELRQVDLALPVRAGTVLAPLVARLEFGPEQAELEPLNSGVFRFDPIYSRWIFDQDFDAGEGRVLSLRSELLFSEVPVRVIDEEVLGQGLFLTGAVPLPAGSAAETLRYGSCVYSKLPLWEIAAEFEGGARALFHERYEEPFAGSGPANVLRGEAWLDGRHFVETSYWRLVYAADHHNWNERFVLVFDPPETLYGVAGVKALFVQEGYDTARPRAALLDSDFQPLRDLKLSRYEKVEVGGTIPGAFLRGEANGDASVNISDPLRVLGWLFAGAEAPWCLDAADANDSGGIEITDAIRILDFLFRGGPPPAPPGPAACGLDETRDALGDCGAPPAGC